MTRGLNPLAVVVYVAVSIDGTDDLGGGGLDLSGALDDVFERIADTLAPAGIEPGGMNVAIDGGVVGDAIVIGEFFRAAPAEEVLLEGVAFWVRAHPAFDSVVGEISLRAALGARFFRR